MSYKAEAVTNEHGNLKTVLDSVMHSQVGVKKPDFEADWVSKCEQKLGDMKGNDSWDLLVEFIFADNLDAQMRDVAMTYKSRRQRRIDVCGYSYVSRGGVIEKVKISSSWRVNEK